MSFCFLLPPSLLSSVVFPCWFPGSFLEAGGARWPLRPSEGLAEVVVSHFLVAVRFPPTSRGQWHRELRAPTQEPRIPSGIPQYIRRWCRTLLFMAVFIVSTLGAVCPCPRTTGCGRNSPVHLPRSFSRSVSSIESV